MHILTPLILSSGKVIYPKLSTVVKDAVLSAYSRNEGNLYKTALDLGISRSTLYRHLKRYNVTVPKSPFKRKPKKQPGGSNA